MRRKPWKDVLSSSSPSLQNETFIGRQDVRLGNLDVEGDDEGVLVEVKRIREEYEDEKHPVLKSAHHSRKRLSFLLSERSIHRHCLSWRYRKQKWRPSHALVFVVLSLLSWRYQAEFYAGYKWLFPKRTHGPKPPANAADLLFGNVTAVRELYQRVYPQQSTNARATSSAWPTIFYNVYIPNEPPSAVRRAVDIVQEQLQQMASSILPAYSTNSLRVLHVRCVTIGRQATLVLNATTLQAHCKRLHPLLNCSLVHHYDSATEVVTLQALYDHCIENREGSNSSRVVYLHSKGSFHDSNLNTAWRRILTSAALHVDCFNPPIDAACNVCGFQFFTQFTNFIPGNMWTADCRYVAQLVPPIHFAARQEEAIAKVLVYRMTGHLQTTSLRDRRDYFGLDRYAVEHWIGSHPNLIPCDLDGRHTKLSDLVSFPQSSVLLRSGSSPGKTTNDAYSFNWSMAPRRPGYCIGVNWAAHQELHQYVSHQYREYYLLPGHIVKWYSLYGQVPPSTSWVWAWFPQGTDWQRAVQEHGADRAIERVNHVYAMVHQAAAMAETAVAGNDPSMAQVSALLHSNRTLLDPSVIPSTMDHYYIPLPTIPATDLGRNDASIKGSTTTARLAVFYDVVLPLRHEHLESSMRLVREQLEILAQAHSTYDGIDSSNDDLALLIYINIFDSQDGTLRDLPSIVATVSTLCREAFRTMPYARCIPRRYGASSGREYDGGETLQHLFEYCSSHTSFQRQQQRVAYIRNQVPPSSLPPTWHSIPNRHHSLLVRLVTRVVLSKECAASRPTEKEHDVCDVCGAAFYTLWTWMFPGNMFTASCDYVRQLAPPNQFEQRLRKSVGQVLLARLRLQITSSLFPVDRMDYFGLERFAMEHWIGSHPSLRPCDVLNKSWDDVIYSINRTADGSDMDDMEFDWALAPRHANAPMHALNMTLKRMVLVNESLRRREVSYLAGRLLQWQSLYGTMPPHDSWVWAWYPDGRWWYDGILEHGSEHVVAALTSQWARDGM